MNTEGAREVIQTIVVVLTLVASCGALGDDELCPYYLDENEFQGCQPWGPWKTVEPCDGLCGGGVAKEVRIRSCEWDAFHCTSVEDKPLQCRVNCNKGIYNRYTQRCDCPVGTTEPCCAPDDDDFLRDSDKADTHVDKAHALCDGRTGEYEVIGNPSQYLKCSGDSSSIVQCPEPLVYGIWTERCMHPEWGSTCVINSILYATGYLNPRNGGQICDASKDAHNWTTVFKCPSPSGQFPQKTHPNAYYRCHESLAFLEFCPPLTSFNKNTGLCELQKRLKDCRIGGHRRQAGETNPRNPEEICDSSRSSTTWTKVFDCPTVNGSFAYPEDRSMYYSCREGKPTQLRTCELNTLFLESWQRCWYAGPTHGCIIEGMFYESGTENPVDSQRYCHPTRSIWSWSMFFECPEHDDKFTNPQDPQSYFICERGEPTLHHCLGGSMYLEQAKMCIQIPRDSYCVIDNTRYAKGYVNPHNASEICTPQADKMGWSAAPAQIHGDLGIEDLYYWMWCPSAEGLFRRKGDRTVFVQCHNSVSHVRKCFNGSIFVDHLKRCSYTDQIPKWRPLDVLDPLSLRRRMNRL